MKIYEVLVHFQVFIAIRTVASSPLFQNAKGNREKRALVDRNCDEIRPSEWTTWGPCYSVMGKYIQSRWRTKQRPFSFSASQCPNEWDERVCEPLDINNIPGREIDRERRRCDLTEWTNWSECYIYMKSMERERHRSPYFSSTGRMKCSEVQATVLVQYEECQNDCAWTSWTPCHEYGKPKEPRWERYREYKSATHRYMLCPGRWVQFQDCEFCEWSSWRSWSSCFEFSSNYERKRERSRVLSDSRRGTKCTKMSRLDAEEYAPCSTEQYYDLSAKRAHSTTPPPKVTESQPQMYTPAATYSFAGSAQGWRQQG